MLNTRLSRFTGGLFAPHRKSDIGETADRLRRDGIDILAWADPFAPDRSLPKNFRKALHAEIEGGAPEHYTVPVGSLELRQALARKLESQNGIIADPSRNIVVTPGADSGLLMCMMALLNPGDEVLVPEPGFPAAFSNCEILGAVPVPLKMTAESGYQLDFDELERAVTPMTKMVFIAHPNNPTGTVFRKSVLQELARFVVKHDLLLLCDQAFEDHIFDGIEFVSPAALPGMADRTVTVFSFSKGYGLSGFRVAYIHACAEIMDVFYGNVTTVCGATSSLAQRLALAALEDEEVLTSYYRKLEYRRNLLFDTLSTVPGVRMQRSESGILSWIDVSDLGTSAEVVDHLLRTAKVLVNDGTAYGPHGAGHLRLVHGCILDDDRAAEVFQRIRTSLLQLPVRGLATATAS
ncbi:pyridoxal phosphate-dependent aminotransferase [Arthrobacter sp. NPDC089319]|uniref:pyridoxal phosphate-dependent aminotransferase n=1 Tax=Arthrobacter sp. NPDC089319 TaxID=3155915 RepID=UPI00341C45FC